MDAIQIYRSLVNIPPTAKGAVVAIGNFDGVHRGHQALLKQAGDIANDRGTRLAVLTFEPHPKELFRPDEPPSRITPAALKEERLAAEGVDIVFSLPFNWDFASMSAEDFVKKILQDALGAAHVVVGFDFHFGQLRKGTPQTIKDAGIPVAVTEEVVASGGEEISSSRIRQHLRRGEIEQARQLLGWGWELSGEVIRGDQRGRELGYPTANMNLENIVHPAYGVYAARVQIEGETVWRQAAVNIGIRPMFEIKIAQVETHIFDFNKEIYGKTLRIKPIRRLRSEARFATLDELIAQMGKDCDLARDILSTE
ncbi:MAG: bifunctional riboflavin kinase/FAD synthetase [Alphaproteobacteria bacterium]|nr:bifunctional riboflavin kinase/FAD synthetase [Alphaproteobacteria bacterium]